MWRAVEAWGTVRYECALHDVKRQSAKLSVYLGYWLVLQLQCVFYHLAYSKRYNKLCGGQWWLGVHHFFTHF